jgi:hypothetical protein
MFFCPNCNNIFDITKTPTQIDEEDKTPISEQEGGQDLIDETINKIINNENVSQSQLEKISINKLLENPTYKKLKSDKKEKVYNVIQDSLNKEKKNIVKNKLDKIDKSNLAFFICNNCGYSSNIKEGTKIFSKTNDEISQTYTPDDYSDLIHSDILPRTRKYVCPNVKCKTNEDPSKREAVFFRKNNSYNVVYICTVCKTSF